METRFFKGTRLGQRRSPAQMAAFAHIGRENMLQMIVRTITADLHRVGPAVIASRTARAPLGTCGVRRGQLGPGGQTRADARACGLGVV